MPTGTWQQRRDSAANQATANWTLQPDDWETLRRQWEYSHAGGALLQMLALAALIVAALRAGDKPARLS